MTSLQKCWEACRRQVTILLSGPAGYFFVCVLLLLYFYSAFTPFRWDPPRQNTNGAIRNKQEVQFVQPGILRSPEPAVWLREAIRENAFLLRLRVSSSSTDQLGPARIFTVSLDPYYRNLTLAQEGSSLVLRLRTTKTTLNGAPAYTIPKVFSDSQWHDIELHVEAQQLTLLVDNKTVLSERLPSKPLKNWDLSYRVAVGNELTGDRPWLGKIIQAKVEVRGESFDTLSRGTLELPTTYWSVLGWKSVFLAPFLRMTWWNIDSILNFACFVPLGFALAFLRFSRASFWLPASLVAALSLVVELLQLGFVDRYPSALDWMMNTLGATVGVGCSVRFKKT